MANADLVRYIQGGIKGYYDRVPLGEIPLPIVGTVGIGQITDLRETLVVIKGIPNTGFNVEYLLAQNVEYFTANMSYNGSATFLGIDLASIEFGETYATVTIGSKTTTYTSQNLDVLVQDLEDFGLESGDAQGLANAIGILWVTIPEIEEAVNEYLDGQDTTDLTGVDGAVHVNLDLGIGGTIESGTLVDIRNIQHVKGTLFDDEIIGSSETNILYGGEGADTLSGGAGHDDLYGGIGNDTIHGDDGAEILYDRGADDGIRDGETTEEYLTRLYAYDGDGNDTLEGGNVKRIDGIYSSFLGLGGTSGFVKKLKLGTVAVLSAMLISTIATVANADVNLDQSYVPPDFNDVVQSVDDTGLVVFEHNGHYRLWGIIPNVPYLRQLVVGKTLQCLQAGKTHRRYLGASDVRFHVRVVYCHQGLPGPYPEGNLTEHLLATGHAIEICAETGNLFGTCNK